MKRIEFIAPVEAIRGNLSGAQDLKYPTRDNKAYEGPVGDINYARNYTPRFIGAKIAASGKKYFTVRTKFANHLTPASKKAMALMGAAGALYASLVRNKTATVYVNLRAQWIALQELGYADTFRKYITNNFRTMLSNKQASVVFAGPKTPVTVYNNFIYGEGSPTLSLPNTVLVKFWDNLAKDGYYFYVDGLTGIADDVEFETFDDIVTKGDKNVLGLSIDEDDYVKYGGLFIIDEDGGYPDKNAVPGANKHYTTTSVAP